MASDTHQTERPAEAVAPAGSAPKPSYLTRHAGDLLLAVAVVLAVWQLSSLMLLLLAGTLIAVALHNLSCLLAYYTHLPLRWARPVTMLLFLGLLIGALALVGAPLITQFEQLAHRIPEAIHGIENAIRDTSLGAMILGGEFNPSSLMGSGIFRRITGFASGAFAVVTDLVLIIFIALYLAAAPQMYRNGVVRLVPIRLRPRLMEALDDTGTALWHWLAGKALSMLVVGVLIGTGLALLGIPMAGALGLLAGILEFVPWIGPLVAAVPAVLIASTVGGDTALWVAGLFVFVQQIESYILMPLISQKAVSLPPVVTITAAVGMGMLFGPLGVVLAEPMAVAAMVMVRKLYVEEVLEDKVPTED